MVYPFRVRIADPEVIRAIKNARKRKNVVDKPVAIKLGRLFQPIRKDVFIGRDNFTRKSMFSIDEMVKVEVKKYKKYHDFIFRRRF